MRLSCRIPERFKAIHFCASDLESKKKDSPFSHNTLYLGERALVERLHIMVNSSLKTYLCYNIIAHKSETKRALCENLI